MIKNMSTNNAFLKTKAEIKVIIKDPIYITAAANLVLFVIDFNCCLKPIRNPILKVKKKQLIISLIFQYFQTQQLIKYFLMYKSEQILWDFQPIYRKQSQKI